MADIVLNISKKSIQSILQGGQVIESRIGGNVITGGGGGVAFISSGIASSDEPTFVDNGNGTATIGNTIVNLYHTDDFTGEITQHNIFGGLFNFTSNTEQYVVIQYNNGTPEMVVFNSMPNCSNEILCFVCWRQNGTIHKLFVGSSGLGLPNKNAKNTFLATPYRLTKDGGLFIRENAGRVIEIEQAQVLVGSTIVEVLGMNSVDDVMTQVYNNNGTFVYNDVTQYQNQYWNNISLGLVILDNNNYVNNFYYRSIGDVKQVFCVVGIKQFHKLNDAIVEQPPTNIPLMVKNHCLFIGKSTIKKNALTGQTDNVFGINYVYATIPIASASESIEGTTMYSTQAENEAINATIDPLTLSNIKTTTTRGLYYFWAVAKTWISGQFTTLSGRVTGVENKTGDATELVKGITQYSTQAECESVINETIDTNVNNTKTLHLRGLWYFWQQVKSYVSGIYVTIASIQSITGHKLFSAQTFGGFLYFAVSNTLDSIGDIRIYRNSGRFVLEYCTTASATKSGGVWSESWPTKVNQGYMIIGDSNGMPTEITTNTVLSDFGTLNTGQYTITHSLITTSSKICLGATTTGNLTGTLRATINNGSIVVYSKNSTNNTIVTDTCLFHYTIYIA